MDGHTLNIISLYAEGPFRLLLILGFFVLLYFGFTSKKNRQLVHPVVMFAQALALSILASLILIQFNAFDPFTILILIFSVVLWTSLQLTWTAPLWVQLNTRKEDLIHSWVKRLETRTYPYIHLSGFLSWKFVNDKIRLFGKTRAMTWCLFGTVIVVAYVSRSSLYDFDRYTLSDLWQQDLLLLKDIGSQQWFDTQHFVLAENVIIVLYKQLTNISWTAALSTFGLMESAVMAGIIFWYISKITRTVIFPGLVGSLAFIFLYGFLFLDVGTMAEHKPIFFALFLFFPASAIMLNPIKYSPSPKNLFYKLFWLFVAIGLSSVFVALIIVPSFMIGMFLWFPRTRRKYLIAATLSFLLATVSVMTLYAIATIYNGDSFGVFLTSYLYAVSSYTFLPQLVLPYSSFLRLLQITAAVILAINVILWLHNRTKWFQILAFHTFFGIILMLSLLENQYFDRDMLIQVIAVCTPVFLSTALFMGYTVIKEYTFQYLPLPLFFKACFVLLFMSWLLRLQDNSLSQVPPGNGTAREILQAYSQLEAHYMPHSYAVVNAAELAPMSTGSHYFITYEAFNRNYLKQDALYARVKNDRAYLKHHPDQILPGRTFVFLHNGSNNPVNHGDSFALERKKIQENLAELKQRRRPVNLFYSSPHLKVYEVVNQPGAGRMTDLLIYPGRFGLADSM